MYLVRRYYSVYIMPVYTTLKVTSLLVIKVSQLTFTLNTITKHLFMVTHASMVSRKLFTRRSRISLTFSNNVCLHVKLPVIYIE